MGWIVGGPVGCEGIGKRGRVLAWDAMRYEARVSRLSEVLSLSFLEGQSVPSSSSQPAW